MTRPWLRLWRSVVNNPKVQRLRPELFRAWVNLLCCADDDGKLPPIADLVFTLRVKEAVVSKWVSELSTAGLIADGAMHDWATHQFQSDVSTDRVKRFRQRSRNAGGNGPEAETDTEADIQKASPSGADAPQSPLDLKKALWASGVAYLKANGVSEANARSFIGLMRKAHDDVAIVDAFARAEAEAAADPVAFIKATLGAKHAAGSKTHRKRHHTTPEDVEAFGRALAGFKMDRPAAKP